MYAAIESILSENLAAQLKPKWHMQASSEVQITNIGRPGATCIWVCHIENLPEYLPNVGWYVISSVKPNQLSEDDSLETCRRLSDDLNAPGDLWKNSMIALLKHVLVVKTKFMEEFMTTSEMDRQLLKKKRSFARKFEFITTNLTAHLRRSKNKCRMMGSDDDNQPNQNRSDSNVSKQLREQLEAALKGRHGAVNVHNLSRFRGFVDSKI